MGIQALKAFCRACRYNPDVRSKVKEIGIDLDEMIVYAGTIGYNISREDFHHLRECTQTEGELHDDDLNEVSGGSSVQDALFFHDYLTSLR